MTVPELEQMLGSEQYLAQLRTETGVWNTLQAARKRALANPANLHVYRNVLERSISRVQAEQGYASVELELADANAFSELYTERLLEMLPIETERGVDFHTWLPRWYPRSYATYATAFKAACDSPSPAKLGRLKDAFLALVAIYRDPPPTEVTKAAV
jgi:hypothetical protein